MKTIPQVELAGAVELTPMEMNAIPFDTGTHSSLTPASQTSQPVAGTAAGTPAGTSPAHPSKPVRLHSLKDL